MKVRVRDIAAKAGVSPSTVSNALNGRAGVSKEIAEKICRIASEMGYSASTEAKRTSEKRYVRLVVFKSHGLVVMDTQFFTELIESIERECRMQGYDLIITHIHAGNDADYRMHIRSLCKEECAGMIVLATEMEKQELELFRNAASPVLMLDNLFSHKNVDTVVINNYEAGYEATCELCMLGHTNIGHITSNVDFSNMRSRLQGYMAALRESGIEPRSENVWMVTPTLEGAYHDMLEYLDQGRKPPTAFFACNDIMAVGCMRALAEMGYKVPEDISVIGMDDVQLAQFYNPPLSTIKVYRAYMGQVAVRTLLSIVNRTPEASCSKVEVGVDLIRRASTRPLKGS